ncbi:3-hydroxyacyl-CoA dehydrogenase family protein [Telmatospirillum sp. J64-1]|uniref:3-hydroxyacyl-CoA dehydrogenase family protein n=1 Tax=Telmatospirillum sp. J64-1 TaxID=2502183 RepID=UPI00115DC27A|nr:3-hydroxyacyl-CoA dehydrogenase family protein [Telmatospirillum sp. J64-1]
MVRAISSVAVIGGGTMGNGIAAASAAAGCEVLLLDIDQARVEKALEKALSTAQDDAERAALAGKIQIGTIDADLSKIADYDWVCEAIIEDLAAKRDLFAKIEKLRRDGSVVSTNTSGIPLRAITEGFPERLKRDMVVTHFFNPVRVMRLLEIVPGVETTPDVLEAMAAFGRDKLGKGVVYAKDTVNFIGNRIGCFWMLSGLHKAKPYLKDGLSMESIDALMGKPVGLPSTGLYGLIDLIGLDVMDFVGKNLSVNLPEGDVGHAFTSFPADEQAMLERKQLGRKTGGGFYRVTKTEDGGKLKETFDLTTGTWREAQAVTLAEGHTDAASLFFGSDAESRFTWDLMGGTLLYAADLVPEISDDVVNVDRAMRWGFAWKKGPFELLDAVGPAKVIAKLKAEGKALPKMLAVLEKAGAGSFYRNGGAEYLGTDGQWHATPAE